MENKQPDLTPEELERCLTGQVKNPATGEYEEALLIPRTEDPHLPRVEVVTSSFDEVARGGVWAIVGGLQKERFVYPVPNGGSWENPSLMYS